MYTRCFYTFREKRRKILRIGFINNSIIYILDKSFSIKTLDSSKINPGKIELINGQPFIPKKNNVAEIERSKLISTNIASQKKYMKKKINL